MHQRVTFERILFDLQLNIYNSAVVHFDSFDICMEYCNRIPDKTGLVYGVDISTGNTVKLRFFNFNYYNDRNNHFEYEYIGNNEFFLILKSIDGKVAKYERGSNV